MNVPKAMFSDPFGRSRVTARDEPLEQRVMRFLAVIEALRAGQALERATATLLADALEKFLLHGIELDKALGLRARRGSHRTPQALIGDERQAGTKRAKSHHDHQTVSGRRDTCARRNTDAE